MARIEKRNVGTYGLPERAAFGRLFWQGWVVGLAEVTVLVGALSMVHSYSFGPLLVDGRTFVRWALVCFYISAVKALFFQFLLRGYTQYTLAQGIGFWSAAEVLSGFNMFLIFDGYSLAKADLVGIPVVFAVGLFWSLTLRRTRSLWFAVGAQAAFDFGATFLYSVPSLVFGFPFGYHLSKAALNGPGWLTGGMMGAEGSPLRFLTIGMLVLLVNKLFPGKDPAQPNAISSAEPIGTPESSA